MALYNKTDLLPLGEQTSGVNFFSQEVRKFPQTLEFCNRVYTYPGMDARTLVLWYVYSNLFCVSFCTSWEG